jgi:hypothetical protein
VNCNAVKKQSEFLSESSASIIICPFEISPLMQNIILMSIVIDFVIKRNRFLLHFLHNNNQYLCRDKSSVSIFATEFFAVQEHRIVLIKRIINKPDIIFL